MAIPNSLFSRLYSRRATEKRNQQENFLTEIFAFVLEHDKDFFASFIQLIGAGHLQVDKLLTIETQKHQHGLGQPDISIVGKDYWILIEAKVESKAGDNQLPKYAAILKSEVRLPDPNKVLVYLTKYPENQDKPKEHNGPFVKIQWDKIYHLIKPEHSTIALQFKNYLKELNMDNVFNFNPHNLSALLHLHDTIRRLDFYLNFARDLFSRTVLPNKISKNVTRYGMLKNDKGYYNVSGYRYGHICIGIVWWYEEPESYLFVSVSLNKANNTFDKDARNKFDQYFARENWSKFEDHPKFEGFENRYPLSKILSENDQENFIKDWYFNRISEIEKLKHEVPEYFWDPKAEEDIEGEN